MSYLLSIVVPTKNRYKYLEKLVELVIGFETSEIELVIQDNSNDNHEFLEFIEPLKRKHGWIKYYYESKYLTTIQNFDLAISQCNGEYVCFIGDDDGVVRNIVYYASWMKENDIEALRPSRAVYYWGNNGRYKQYATFEAGKKEFERLSPIHELIKILKGGCCNLGCIPVLYTGIVKRILLDEIYKDFGTYFPGVSPDAANGTVLSFYVKRYVLVNNPIVITGTSSQTGGGLQKKRIVELKDVPFLRREDFKDWEGVLPPIWTGSVVWPGSVISALRKMGKEELISEIDFDLVYANFYYLNKDYKDLILEYVQDKKRFYRYYLIIKLNELKNNILNKIVMIYSSHRRNITSHFFFGLSDIIEAENQFYKISNKK